MFTSLREHGIRRPRLYALGLDHNNCGGGCVKAGQAHWSRLYHALPAAYRWWESKEQEIRAFLGKDVSILTDRSGGGIKKPLTLAAFRNRLAGDGQVDMFDTGGCGCFAGDDEQAPAIEAAKAARMVGV